jgi:hypothetical protein
MISAFVDLGLALTLVVRPVTLGIEPALECRWQGIEGQRQGLLWG